MLLLSILLGLLMNRACFSANVSTHQSTYEFSDGLVSVQAINTAYNILSVICEMASINLIVDKDLSKKNRVVFKRLPLEQAVRHLVGSNGLLMTYDPSGKITEIRVYNHQQGKPAADISSITRAKKIQWIDSLAGQAEDIALVELERVLIDKSNDIAITEYVIAVLGEMANKQVSHILAKGLRDNRSQVRDSIVFALGKQGDLNASLILAQVLYGDPSQATKLKAVEQLALSGAPIAKVFLQSMLKDNDMDIQAEAEFFLGSHNEINSKSRLSIRDGMESNE